MKYLLRASPLILLLILAIPMLIGRTSAHEIIRIQTEQGTVQFKVEVADEPHTQEAGLMHRTSLPDDEGMLFLFTPPRKARMWMKNTQLPLDMIFIESNGKIASVEENTTPYSEKTIDPGHLVRAVLEVPAGTAQKHGIDAGDVVLYERLQETAPPVVGRK